MRNLPKILLIGCLIISPFTFAKANEKGTPVLDESLKISLAIAEKEQCPKTLYDYNIAKMLQTFCGTTIWNKITPAYTLKSGVEQHAQVCASTLEKENVMPISSAVSTSMLIEMGANPYEFCHGYRQRLDYLFDNNQTKSKK